MRLHRKMANINKAVLFCHVKYKFPVLPGKDIKTSNYLYKPYFLEYRCCTRNTWEKKIPFCLTTFSIDAIANKFMSSALDPPILKQCTFLSQKYVGKE